MLSGHLESNKNTIIHISNISTLSLGSKIRLLPSENVEFHDIPLKNNSYLYTTYKFYKSNGFLPYIEFKEFIKDYGENNPYCIIRTFMTLFKTLVDCCNYPFFKGKERYYYKSIEEQNQVEDAIINSYYLVFNELISKLDLELVNNFNNLSMYIKLNIKYKVHLSRILKSNDKIKQIDFSQISIFKGNTTSSPIEDKYILKEFRLQLKNIINNYIKDKDVIDRLIITNYFMRYGFPFGDSNSCRWTLNKIATICGVTRKTVFVRKQKIIKELTQLYNNEIHPLLIN
jgi:hypothetical protein